MWKIIYEDNLIIVVHKMAGIATESAKLGSKDLVSELRKYLKKNGVNYLGVVHRLDQPVEGLLVFGKTSESTAKLSKQVQFDENNSKKSMTKLYKAIVYNHFENELGMLEDYLLKDSKSNTSKVVDSTKAKEVGAKKAVLDYKVINRNKETDEIEIELKTGRHHQIRVQMANANHPLVGDLKYGSDESKQYSEINGYKNVQLKAFKLEFNHPENNRRMSFEI